MTVMGILLAAGFSTRFGVADKLMQRLPNGELMAVAAAKNLVHAIPSAIAVVKHEHQALANALEDVGIRVEFCASSASSMAESLVTALTAAIRHVPADGCVIALADMPFISPNTIKSVAEKIQAGHGIVIPTYQHQRGHPVGFSKAYFASLCQITGDNGGKAIVQRHEDNLTLVPCEDAGILQDIDTPDKLTALWQIKPWQAKL